MSLDMLSVNESFTPKRFLNDAFVTEYTIGRHVDSWIIVYLSLEYSQIMSCLIIDASLPLPPCKTGKTINVNDSHNSDG